MDYKSTFIFLRDALRNIRESQVYLVSDRVFPFGGLHMVCHFDEGEIPSDQVAVRWSVAG